MANLLRQEGDFTYWDDGAQRYAKGNSLGKAPGSLAKRHPKAALPSSELSVAKRRERASLGGKATRDNRRRRVMEAHDWALTNHPDSVTEEDGLRMLAMAGLVQGAEKDGGGPAVAARQAFLDQYAGGKPTSKPTVNVGTMNVLTMNRDGADYLRALELEIIDAEAREIED